MKDVKDFLMKNSGLEYLEEGSGVWEKSYPLPDPKNEGMSALKKIVAILKKRGFSISDKIIEVGNNVLTTRGKTWLFSKSNPQPKKYYDVDVDVTWTNTKESNKTTRIFAPHIKIAGFTSEKITNEKDLNKFIKKWNMIPTNKKGIPA